MPTILITGASTGIGKATAIEFSNRGWNVAATMRTPEKGKDLLQYKGIKTYPLDVMDKDSIKKAVDAILNDFGDIDVLFNNAGYGLVGIFESMSTEQLQRQFNTNVMGVLQVTQALLPLFRKKRKGLIINTSSMGGRITFPLYSVYHGTKWALEGFMESLQFELKPFNIRIKNIEPGSIRTDFDTSLEFISHPDYDSYARKAHENMLETYKTAPGPEMVARLVYKAATDGSWKLRYPASLQSRFLLFLRWLLGYRIFNRIVKSIVEKGIR